MLDGFYFLLASRLQNVRVGVEFQCFLILVLFGFGCDMISNAVADCENGDAFEHFLNWRRVQMVWDSELNLAVMIAKSHLNSLMILSPTGYVYLCFIKF